MFKPSMEDVLRSGELIYLETLKKELEIKNFGQYLVIDTETGKYVVKESQLEAVETAKKDLGDKLFYIVKIGSLDKPTINHRMRQEYAWNL